MSDPISNVVISPYAMVADIAELCRAHSTDDSEVHARIEHVNGKPVVFLVRESIDAAIPSYLRKQAI